LFAVASAPALAQESVLHEEAYLAPASEIARIVTAPRHENLALTNLSPDQRYFLTTLGAGMPSIADYAKPHYNLGGLFIDYRANRARSFSTGTGIGFELVSAEDGRRVRIAAPSGARVSSAKWSPDGKSLAYFAHFADATYLYVAEAASGRSRRVVGTPLLATLVTTFEWTDGGRSIVAVLVPEGRGAAPKEPAVPTQPQVYLTQEGENKLRTYASLLQTPHEQALLEYYTTGQLATIEVGRGRVRKIGRPAMIRSMDPAPRGDYLRVTTMQRPFSYIVPVNNFGTVEEIWGLDGKVLAELQRRPLNEGVRVQRDSTAVDNERRSLAWRPDGQGLSFLQQEPAPARQGAETAEEGTPAAERAPARRKDRVMQWLPPFDSTSTQVVYTSDNRLGGAQYSTDPKLLFLSESARGSTHVYAVSLDEPETKHTIYRHRTEDFYTNPGTLMTTTEVGAGGGFGGGSRGAAAPSGTVRLSSDGSAVYLVGTTYSKDPLKEAPRPFIDRVEIRSGTKERLFESAADRFERVTAVLDDDLARVVISRESPTMVQDYFLVDRQGGGAERKLTANVDHSPEITAAQRRIVEVTRADGINFWVRVTLPAEHTPGTRLPAMFWFYPREYTDQKSYDQTNRTHNKNQFPRVGPRTMEILTRAGYAVIEPDAPIIGPAGRMNDFYVPDLRNNLSAVIDELDRQGIIDRSRLGLGGHSYGAFGTVNAMIQTPFFKAGIAGDGNSNRTLTPITFQTERRELWEAREVYLEMSPILYAERLSGALLMYHGMDDQNVGTHPGHSTRLFHALNGLGKTASLYMYPYEDHGPVTRETLLDMWARWVAWLDKYVKNAEQPGVKAEVAAAEAAN
jgi:dipeptidyl aminopeptidase/acylaminoacyl peptidase